MRVSGVRHLRDCGSSTFGLWNSGDSRGFEDAGLRNLGFSRVEGLRLGLRDLGIEGRDFGFRV